MGRRRNAANLSWSGNPVWAAHPYAIDLLRSTACARRFGDSLLSPALGGGGWMPYDRFREVAMRHALPPSEYAAACASSAEPGAPPVSVDTLVQDTLTGSRSSGGGGDRAGRSARP